MSREQQTQAMARYATVRRLGDRDAAAVLGVKLQTLREYRRMHPEFAPVVATEAAAPPVAPRPNVRVVVGKTGTAPACSSATWATCRVSLPREPWL